MSQGMWGVIPLALNFFSRVKNAGYEGVCSCCSSGVDGLGSEALEANAKFHPLGGVAGVRADFENDSLSVYF